METTDFQQVLASPIRAYEEGLNFFEGKGMLNETLHKLADDLKNNGIEYNIIGAIALNLHGYQRFTTDIDLLMTKEGLEKFHQFLVGVGYRPAFEGARKKFRATERNIPIEVITTGEYPGDGKIKPISFPAPNESCVEIDGVQVLSLEMLVTLKLASGMTHPGRLKDLADVQELIKIKGLTSSFSERLHPFVREKFMELYEGTIHSGEAQEPGE